MGAPTPCSVVDRMGIRQRTAMERTTSPGVRLPRCPTPGVGAATRGGADDGPQAEPTYNLADLWEMSSTETACPIAKPWCAAVGGSTYGDLEERANRLANHLSGLGVGPGDFVGCYLPNRIEYIETLLACFKIRAVPVNMNYRYVDRRAPAPVQRRRAGRRRVPGRVRGEGRRRSRATCRALRHTSGLGRRPAVGTST